MSARHPTKITFVFLFLLCAILFALIYFATGMQALRRAQATAAEADIRAHQAGLKVMEQEFRVKYLEEMLFRRTGWEAKPTPVNLPPSKPGKPVVQ